MLLSRKIRNNPRTKTMKNNITFLGGLLSAIGPIVQINVPYANAFWIGMIMSAVGSFLLGSRGLFETPSK